MARNAKPARKTLLARAATAVVLPALLVGGLAGCSGDSSSGASASPSPSGTPGEVKASNNSSVVTVTGAVAHLDASGDGTLSMTVRNSGTVTDHLDMVGAPGGARGKLTGAKGTKGNGALNTAGIQILPNGSTTFGSSGGPTVAFHHVKGVTSRHTLPIILQFGVAGLVRMEAHVTK
ncbi:hypothetical protein [Streptomyces sp. NRRL F-5126]|uniref:hypothetical protein n=1 Tax=Streptomyces sp. NRRL F-5126 TaxID=1463857 RepID=UPI00068AB504|nr:hypothetical protein [Streptomyces sp. NRRL F-5126]